MSAGYRVSFEQAFPTIEEVEVEVEEKGRGRGSWGSWMKVYKRPHWPDEHLLCHNSLCVKGGFPIWKILGKMVSQRKTDARGSELCQGYEGSPMGRRRYGPCPNIFMHTIRLRYKENAEPRLKP